nr:sporulation protein YunB [uncultured Anaerotignum sp.]
MRKKRRKRKRKPPFFLLLFLLLFLLAIVLVEKSLLPPLKEISHLQCKAMANRMIDQATADILSEMELDANALVQEGADGESYTANTALVNQFCALLSQNITERLYQLPKEEIRIPLGAVTHFGLFANQGPAIPFTLMPMGAVKVDYETSFSSVGINQINYKIWLAVKMELRIVNPLYQEELSLSRKIMLADLVFSGRVPNHYFQISRPNEYLLTE